MKEFCKRGKRVLVAFLSALLIITQLGIFPPVATYAQEAEGNEYQAAEVKSTEAATGADGTTVLTFTSDIHNQSNNTSANRLDTWLNRVRSLFGEIEAMNFCGDMGSASGGGDSWWGYVQSVMDVVDKQGLPGVYTTGNHEFMNGSYSSTSNASAKKYIVGDVGREGDNYVIYCLGSVGQSDNITADQINKLNSFLSGRGTDKPIIVLVHFPMHTCSGNGSGWGTMSRTTTNADQVIDALNSGASEGQKIVLLWGHNHTLSDPFYDQVFVPGDELEYKSGSKKTINFYYGAAGCMSDSEYGTGSAYVNGKGLVLTIDSQDKLTMTYLNENGTDVTEGGTFKEDGAITPYNPGGQDDTPTGDTVNITPATSNPETSIKINIGDTLTINTTNGSTSSAYDFTATLSKSGVAEIQGNSTVNIAAGATGQFTVKGLTQGTVDITIQNNGSYSTRKGTIHLTVGEGGEDPVNPPVEGDVTVDISPSTSNPAASAEISIGETLVINVKNESTRSAYTFTATLGKENVAEFQGGSTVTVAAGETGQLVVKGLADGNVDINITNGNTQSERKGTIHLKVGKGEETPAAGDIQITPESSNSPEVSYEIGVDETFTIDVKNGSSGSAYDFTVTFSKSGVAEIQGSSTANIAAGATKQFTVKGIADGNVDITIQNNGSYSTRKGTIHLKVGEGDEDPVDPPVEGDVTVNISPATTYPAASAEISIGETLVINVKNESTRSAYTFTATLGKEGVAEFQGGSTVTVAAGATGQLAVKGLADGNVDINITNGNTQSERKGTIHLKVGAGDTHEHTWDDGAETTPATCTEAGVKTYTCTGCGETKTEAIKALGHNYQEVEGSAKDATCTEAGKEADKKCSRCGDEVAGKEIAALGHNFGEWTTVKEATETETGLKERTCSRCSEKEQEEIPKITPEDPVDATVDISPATSNPSASAEIKIDDILVINVKNESTRSEYTFTATLSKEGVAEFKNGSTVTVAAGATGQLAVKGIADGNVDINITNGNAQSERKGTIHLKVGAGDTPVDPPTGDTVDITPTTDNPEETIKINIGDTLTINVKNGSSGSAYDFTASLSKEGIAEIQGDATINIKAGEVGKFNVKGLAEGNVDITIQNENSYSSQYARKGTVHVVVVDDGTPAHEHSWGDGVVTTEPTCTAEGVKTFTCSECGETKTESVDALGHDYKTAEGTAKDPTCTEKGKEADQKCSRCQDVITGADIAALGHNYQAVAGTAKDPTCTEKGKEADQKCSRCNETVTGADIPAKGHDWNVVTEEATCTEAGLKTSTCKVCGEVEKEVLPVLGHAFGEWEDATPATCTEKGTRIRTCRRCAEFEQETIPALGHAFGEWEDATPATCTQEGIRIRTCKQCSEFEQETIPKIDHKYGEWKITTAPTCTEKGIRSRTCEVCNAAEENDIPALGHNYQDAPDTAAAATCTEAGKEAGQRCTRCDDVLPGAEIPALGHDFHEEVPNTAKAATCTEAGREADIKCTRCDEVLSGKEIPALGHDFGEWYTEREASETETGLKIRSCKRCNEKEEEVIPMITPSKPDDKPAPVPSKDDSKSTVPTKITGDISPSNPVSTATVNKQILEAKTDADPKGSVFNLLQAKGVAKSNTSIKVSWTKVKGAKKYIIYTNQCGTKYRFKKIKEVTGTSFTQKGLKKGKYYKYLIVAVNGNKALATSKGIHVATKGGKVGNSKAVTTKAKKNRVTLKKGKTFKLGAKAVPQNKKLKVKKHRAIAYESSNKKIATVSAKGVIKGVKKGTCYVYAYAQNGVCKKIKVTVK